MFHFRGSGQNRGAVLRRISELAHENLTQIELGPDYLDIKDTINDLIIDICNKSSLTGVEQIGKKRLKAKNIHLKKYQPEYFKN